MSIINYACVAIPPPSLMALLPQGAVVSTKEKEELGFVYSSTLRSAAEVHVESRREWHSLIKLSVHMVCSIVQIRILVLTSGSY